MSQPKPFTLAELRQAATRAFGRGTQLSRTNLSLIGRGERLSVYAGSRVVDCSTSMTIYHATSPQLARQRLLRILTVLANRRERRLRSGNVFCWSKP